MRKTYGKDPVQCSKCPRTTTEPRLGMCFCCYQRDRRGTGVPIGATCHKCGESDPLVLSATPFGVLCWNDHARARAAVA